VYVTLKKGVLDPQGKAVVGALKSFSFSGVKELRIGKFIEIDMDGSDKAKAEAEVKKMCEVLLANTVIEDYKVEIKD